MTCSPSTHAKADDATKIEVVSKALKIALAKARDASSNEAERQIAAAEALRMLEDADTLLQSGDELVTSAGCSPHVHAAVRKLRFLCGEVCCVQGANSSKARDNYEAALSMSQKLMPGGCADDGLQDLTASRSKDAKIHLSFALFCDGQIRSLVSKDGTAGKSGVRNAGEGATGRAGDENVDSYVVQYMENLLEAISKGSAMAKEYFPRSLELLVEMQNSNEASAP